MSKIRIRIAGIYIENNKILLVKHKKRDNEYYLLPGGGQEPGESQKEAIKREYKEELNLDIEVGDLAFIGESVPPKGVFKTQILQIVFEVKSISGTIKLADDPPLHEFKWQDIESMRDIKFFPGCLDQLFAYVNKNDYQAYQKYNWLK